MGKYYIGYERYWKTVYILVDSYLYSAIFIHTMFYVTEYGERLSNRTTLIGEETMTSNRANQNWPNSEVFEIVNQMHETLRIETRELTAYDALPSVEQIRALLHVDTCERHPALDPWYPITLEQVNRHVAIDPFFDCEPCWDGAETQALLTAFYQCNEIGIR